MKYLAGVKPPVSTSDLSTRLADVLHRVLTGIPAVLAVRSRVSGESADVTVVVDVFGGGTYALLVAAKTNAEPRHARIAAAQLVGATEEWKGASDAVGILGAPFVSERSAALLAEQGVGYVDLAGNARLAFGPVYVERSGNPNPYADDRPLAALFAPKTSRVARALLAHPTRVWRLQELADEVTVSLGLVAKAKTSLLDAEYARDTPDGLALADPDGLLDAWLVADRRRAKPRGYYSLDSIPDAERRIADAAQASGARAALTSFSGAERVAPHVRYSHASMLVDADAMQDVAERAGLRPVNTGANVHLHTPYDDGVFYGSRDVDGIPVAHSVQLVLDLMREKGRGEEAADHLRRHVLVPTWVDLTRNSPS